MTRGRQVGSTWRPAPLAVLAGVLVLACLSLASVAHAQSSANFQSESSRSQRDRSPSTNLPGSGRYVSETGQGFILDRSSPATLMRFDRSTEVWVLRPSPAPRGDIIFRNDAGDQVLRVTPDGGMTLYTTAAPQGSPVSAAGPAPELLAPTLTAFQLMDFILRQSDRATRAVGRIVVVDMDIEPGSEPVATDALSTAVDAIVRMARSPSLRRDVARVQEIIITDIGPRQVSFSRGTLRIVIDPDAGFAGRPSSARIVRVIAGVE